MEGESNKEELEKSISETKEKMKKELEYFNMERKAALTWNIIFFIGILGTSLTINLFVNKGNLDFQDILNSKLSENLSLLKVILGLLVSFLIGILGSFFKNKSLKSKTDFDVSEFLKESYINRLDKSRLNPKNSTL